MVGGAPSPEVQKKSPVAAREAALEQQQRTVGAREEAVVTQEARAMEQQQEVWPWGVPVALGTEQLSTLFVLPVTLRFFGFFLSLFIVVFGVRCIGVSEGMRHASAPQAPCLPPADYISVLAVRENGGCILEFWRIALPPPWPVGWDNFQLGDIIPVSIGLKTTPNPKVQMRW